MKIVTAVGATPNRMQIVYEFLAHSPGTGIEREKLSALVAPQSLARKDDAGEDNAFADCISAGVELGLFRRDEDRIALTDAASLKEYLDAEFVARIERALLPPEISTLTAEGAVAGAIAWMLCQDPHKGFGSKGSPSPITMFRAQMGHGEPDYDLGNDERFRQVVYWARFLGFVSRLRLKDSSLVVPDPTQAIVRHLEILLPQGTEKPVVSFLADLARVCPVLEGGRARMEVETRLPSELQREQRVLSRSTVLALLRLRKRGVVAFRRLDDGQVVVAEGLQDDGRVTHVRRAEVVL